MPEAIVKLKFDEFVPFGVILVSPEDDPARYLAWKKTNRSPPLIVAEAGGDLRFRDLTLERLKEHCIEVVGAVGKAWPPETEKTVRERLAEWRPPTQENIGYTIGGHNAFTPNVLALEKSGYSNICDERFWSNEQGIGPFVKEIVRTATSILDERARIGDRDMFRINPRRPDLMLFSPSIYQHLRENPLIGRNETAEEKKAGRALQLFAGQRGYRFELAPEKAAAAGLELEGGEPKVNPVFQVRQQELLLETNAIGLLAASEFSAVVRWPNEINRTAGQIRQLASQQRGNDARARKRLKAFNEAQLRLHRATPPEFMDLIRRSETGIRIVADAPLEWLDVDGVPLGVEYDVSRIPTTPGNILITQLLSRPVLRLQPEVFDEILILNAIAEDDPIHPFFGIALGAFQKVLKDRVKLRQVEVRSKQDFVDAINDFDGVMMIFNGHGSHAPDEPAYLWLGDEKVDTWHLKAEIPDIPPIVLLSACDTHAADRNHATTAMGFLSLGAVTVLGSFFPLAALDASVFAARLVFRVGEFIPAAIKAYDRSITWSEVVGGMIRMTLVHDYLWRLHLKGLISEETYEELHMYGSGLINSFTARPFDKLIDAVAARGFPEPQARAEFKLAVATSSAISYVQLGRPEVILFDTPERIKQQFEEIEERVGEMDR